MRPSCSVRVYGGAASLLDGAVLWLADGLLLLLDSVLLLASGLLFGMIALRA